MRLLRMDVNTRERVGSAVCFERARVDNDRNALEGLTLASGPLQSNGWEKASAGILLSSKRALGKLRMAKGQTNSPVRRSRFHAAARLHN